MRTLANLSIDALLNFLFGWRNDINGVEAIITANKLHGGNKIVVGSITLSIEEIRQKNGFAAMVERFYQDYFWYKKSGIIRFVIYLSSAVHMQNGAHHYLPFIAFSPSTPKQIMDETVYRWHGKHAPRPQGFLISFSKLGSDFSGICYLPVGLLFDKLLSERVLPKNAYAVHGIERIKCVKAKIPLSSDLIPLAALNLGRQGFSTVEIIGDYGEAVPTQQLADDSGLNLQPTLFND